MFLFAGEWIISSHDVECISIGAGILGCGGGGDPNVGRAAAQQLLSEGKKICLKDPHKYDILSLFARACSNFIYFSQS